MKKYTIVIAIIVCFLINGCSANQKEETEHLHTVESFSLSKYDSTDMILEVDSHENLTFFVEPEKIEEKDIEIINEDDSVAKVLLQDINNVSGNRLIIISVRGLKLGETNIKVKGIENGIESEVIHLTVVEKKENTDSSRNVYVNYSGNKYHLNSSCAGKSAYLTSEKDALKLGKEACSKCFN